MDLNDLPALMKMEGLQLSWLMQSLPTWFNKDREIKSEWAAYVTSLEKVKGKPYPYAGYGYGATPEEAVLAAIDNFKKPSVEIRRAPVGLEDLEIEI